MTWSEVYQRWAARAVDVAGLRADVETLGLEIVPLTAEDAEHAAELWSPTRQLGLSLGDRACRALAAPWASRPDRGPSMAQAGSRRPGADNPLSSRQAQPIPPRGSG